MPRIPRRDTLAYDIIGLLVLVECWFAVGWTNEVYLQHDVVAQQLKLAAATIHARAQKLYT
jgi:hypothetical protein